VPEQVWVLLGTAALLVPGLGRFGLWEPWEAELVPPAARPWTLDPVAPALAALGLRLHAGEVGLRAGFVALALATALAVHWAARGLHGARAARLAVAVLLGLPLFSLQARQLTSEMPLVLALALATGGLGRLAWGPARGGAVAAAVGLAGLAFGLFAGGALVGVLAPCAALAAAVLVEPPARLAPRQRRVLVSAAGAVAAAVAVLVVARRHPAAVPSLLLGGTPRLAAGEHTFEELARQAGFGLFPWGALAFFALGRGFGGAPPEGVAERDQGPALFLLLLTTFVVALSAVRGHLVGDVRFVALAPVALALGAFLDQALVAGAERMVAFFAAVGTVLIGRDLFLEPEVLVSVHTLGKVRWPPVLPGGAVMLGAALAIAAAITIGLVTRHRRALLVGVGLALAFAVYLDHGLVPALSRHLSRRAVVDIYRRAARAGEPLARYRVEGPGAAAWLAAPGPALATVEALAGYLTPAAGPRRFALVAAGELGAVDQAIKLAGGRYGVLDASSQLLLLVSRLEPGESDRNPLLRFVWSPGTTASPPWPPPRVTTSAVFGDAVELVGADFPTTVRRPGSLTLALVFRVLRRPPPGYSIFVHLEAPGEGFINGDHPPVGGTFPTERWLPGESIRDEHVIELPLDVSASPLHHLFVGLWPGGNRPRLPITAGATDGANRCPLGMVTVR